VQLIAEGRYEEAYLTARSPNPFASICGRICAAPCEDKCRRGRIDAPVSIRALKRFVCDRYGVESLVPDKQDRLFHGATEPGNKTRWHLPVLTTTRNTVARGQRVSVIGGGPAGLACAHDLALMGYRVTVFEASESPGGMLIHGIPEFRLSRAVIDKEISKIQSLGVEILTKSPLSENFGLEQLRGLGFEAVFLSIGTQRGRELNIEGSDLDGVIKAVDYLINVNQGYRVDLGQRVVVIGGGFVAFDAARMALRRVLENGPEREDVTLVEALDVARTVLRAGVADVRMVSLESFAEMPIMRSSQGREEFEQAKEEGIKFETQRSARRFLRGYNGRVGAVELIGVKRTYDDNGRFDPVFDDSFSELVEADSVILAIGQQADLSFLKAEDGIELTPQRTIKVDHATLATTAPGVFAGGDVAFGPRNVIEAIANGKQAALSIDDYLRGVKTSPAVHLSMKKIPIRDYRMPDAYEKCERLSPPTVPLGRRTGISEVESSYSEADARRQAERCLHCHIQTVYDPERCVLCSRCVDVCPERCLKLVPMQDLDLQEGSGTELIAFYGFEAAGPLNLSAMIKDEELCIRCGLCAIRCPTNAMTLEVFSYEERDAVA
jgi:NADPH-dependent glutamate synthase beta subunit-like oxidoreductase